MVTVDDPDDDLAFVPALIGAGYPLRVIEPGHRMFHSPALDVHVHLWRAGSEDERRHLLFRDWLRASADDRERYETVKRDLAAREWVDSNDYADAKTEIVMASWNAPSRGRRRRDGRSRSCRRSDGSPTAVVGLVCWMVRLRTDRDRQRRSLAPLNVETRVRTPLGLVLPGVTDRSSWRTRHCRVEWYLYTRYEAVEVAASKTWSNAHRGLSGPCVQVYADSPNNFRPAASSSGGSAESSNVAMSNVPPSAVGVDVTWLPCTRPMSRRVVPSGGPQNASANAVVPGVRKWSSSHASPATSDGNTPKEM
jgi:hypothetical protein